MVSIILLKSFSYVVLLFLLFFIIIILLFFVVVDAEFATTLTTEQNNIYFSNPPLTWQRPLCFSAFFLFFGSVCVRFFLSFVILQYSAHCFSLL